MDKVDYDDRQHAVYARGRALSPSRLRDWLRVYEGHAPAARPLSVLDLGSGTGRFTPGLADVFGGPVYGVEPSVRMRQVAEQSAAHRAVTYLDGSAESIPLPDSSVDLVLMFLVLHHVENRPAAAAEIARVLRRNGRLLIRNVFADRMPQLWWHSFFPSALPVEKRMFPSLADVEQQFSSVGLNRITLDEVTETYAESKIESAERLRLQAISTFEFLSSEEIDAGFARMDAEIAAETSSEPVTGRSDLLVLGKDG